MSDKKFSKQHEWISAEGDIATVGITKHAAEMLGDVVFVELPEKGKNVSFKHMEQTPRRRSRFCSTPKSLQELFLQVHVRNGGEYRDD